MNYLTHVRLAVSQFINAITGGDEDETLSSRTGRNAIAGKWWALVLEPIIDLFFGKGHCRRAIGQ